MTTSKIRLAAYLRVSTDDQRERETIKGQEELIADFLRRNPQYELVGTFKDDGVSGTIPLAQRPEGGKLFRQAVDGRFDAILVTRMDRLGRDPIDLFQSRSVFQSFNIKLVGVVEDLDDELAFDFRAVLAKEERRRLCNGPRKASTVVRATGCTWAASSLWATSPWASVGTAGSSPTTASCGVI